MAAKDFWTYYRDAWLKVKESLIPKLTACGFSPKGVDGKFEIGNEHGEVYLYPTQGTALAGQLLMVEIYPSNNGNLLLRLTCPDRKAFQGLDRRLRTALSPIGFGTPGKNKEGRYVGEYYFYTGPRPSDPADLGEVLLATASRWFDALASCTE